MIGPHNSREDPAFRWVVYAGTTVFRNKLGIRNQTLLDEAEREFAAVRAAQLFPRAAHCRSYAGFRAIHRHLFQDLYPWAGKERRGSGLVPFPEPEYIGPMMEQVFQALGRDGYLVGSSRPQLARSAAYYVNEINAVHAFFDGNGRTQRFWLRMLAADAGFRLTFKSSDRPHWNEASRRGFHHADHASMAALLEARLHPLA